MKQCHFLVLIFSVFLSEMIFSSYFSGSFKGFRVKPEIYLRPIWRAARTGDEEAAVVGSAFSQALKSRKVYLRTPLHEAVVKGHLKVVQIFLTRKIKVDSRNFFGNTPLHIAAFHGHTVIADELMEAGADPKARNNLGETPYMRAKARGYGKAMKPILYPD